MKSPAVDLNVASEIQILARILGDNNGTMPPLLARYILNREFSEGDKTRIHELVTRNQADDLSAEEKQELQAYAKAGTLLSILKANARRTLRMKSGKRVSS